ncbi:hypothetical protein LCL97_13585 [Seohaeicola saemankumensis]|nr:hypothetical protein [Seohaeicola saemankumensis]MCA0871865.1 hypothetical protein [Seohaeicola saemankumensis]
MQSVARFWLLVGVWVMVPAIAVANMPLGPFFGAVRLAYWPVAPVAVLIEVVALKLFFDLSWKQAATVGVLVNVITAVVGVPLYPVISLALYPVLTPFVTGVFGYGAMVEVGALSFGFGVLDAGLELLLLRHLFKVSITLGRGLAFLIANLLSAAVLFGAIYWSEISSRLSEEEFQSVMQAHDAEIAVLAELLAELPGHFVYNSEARLDPLFHEAWTETWGNRLDSMTVREVQVVVGPDLEVLKSDRLPGERRLAAIRSEGDTRMQRVLIGEGRTFYTVTLVYDGITRFYSVSGLFPASDPPD